MRKNTYKLIKHIIPGEMTTVYLPRNEPINWMEGLNSTTKTTLGTTWVTCAIEQFQIFIYHA